MKRTYFTDLKAVWRGDVNTVKSSLSTQWWWLGELYWMYLMASTGTAHIHMHGCNMRFAYTC